MIIKITFLHTSFSVYIPWLKQNKTKQNKTKQDKTKQNKTKQNKTKQNKTKQNKTKQNKTKQKNHHYELFIGITLVAVILNNTDSVVWCSVNDLISPLPHINIKWSL